MIGRIKTWLAAAGAVVLAVAVAFLRGRATGRNDAETEALRDEKSRTTSGRDAIREGRDTGLSPSERVRRNDGDWRGL